MERKPRPKKLLVSLLLSILSLTWLVHSRNLASSPSPASASVGVAPKSNSLNPFRGKRQKAMRGSFPATCHSKCNQCRPCVPVEVSIRTIEVEEYHYYPMVWKCMCRSFIFSP
ncbi:hypothetical protein L6164_035776 [Bauhinia variegata]|uniref:Uncharacterized protein n=1 Tax=Bauhinia variegata TaxID=167791 RepID=A0ACB9KF53_BAUVA|nr:hypothetical protein L6164_035776 [Bauhinia variegata]